MQRLIEAAYWWVAKRVFGTRRVGDLAFVYVEAANDTPASEIEAVLAAALRLISHAQGGFGELVTSHLSLVAVSSIPRPYASVGLRAYISPFAGHEATNSEYLACQLVWAATFVRLSRDSLARGVRPDVTTTRRAAFEAQLRFVRQFANSEEWSQYLLENTPESR